MAIKQIEITDIPEDQLKVIQKEITVMKKLSHKHIVKYIGIKHIDVMTTDNYLNIVLEYIENGSLAESIKKFKTFQEPLVANFTRQVLKGLQYLHSQGIAHRDIKGANLLSTKNGTVKLADFGLAMKLTESIKSRSIVGTPFWMAPEIVQQNAGCNTSCDIWSVGCTVIELITGNPPYYELHPMCALFRIVNDEYPPLPEQVSGELRDFLLKCFQKEPLIRQSATDLLKHAWLKGASSSIDLETKENISIDSSSCKSPSKSSVYSQFLNQSSRPSSVHSSLQIIDNEAESESSALSETLEELEKSPSPKLLHSVLSKTSSIPSLKKQCKTLIPTLRSILEEAEEFDLLHLSLQLTNSLCSDHDMLITCGCIGLLSSALKYIGEEFCKELRIEAAFLIGSLYSYQDSTFHMFLASGGVEASVKLIDPNFSQNKELVIIGIDCLLGLLESGGSEYIRLCASFGAVERLALALDNTSTDSIYETYAEKVADLLMIFSTVIEK